MTASFRLLLNRTKTVVMLVEQVIPTQRREPYFVVGARSGTWYQNLLRLLIQRNFPKMGITFERQRHDGVVKTKDD